VAQIGDVHLDARAAAIEEGDLLAFVIGLGRVVAHTGRDVVAIFSNCFNCPKKSENNPCLI